MAYPARPEPRNREEHLFEGRRVVDERGAAVGTVTGVVREDGRGEPEWLIVDSRWRRSERYVPVAGSWPSSNGDLVIPFDRSWVAAAPRTRAGRADVDHRLRRRLAAHYDNTYDWLPRSHVGAALVT